MQGHKESGEEDRRGDAQRAARRSWVRAAFHKILPNILRPTSGSVRALLFIVRDSGKWAA